MSENGKLGAMTTAFAIGAAIGAGVALLYAPCSGSESRQYLANKGRNIKDRLTGAAEETMNAVGVRRSTSSANV
jgi:gas vesicle protein